MSQTWEDMIAEAIRRVGQHKKRTMSEKPYAQCPQCNKEYELKLEWRTDPKYEGRIEREMWMSGYCSETCWNKVFDKKK